MTESVTVQFNRTTLLYDGNCPLCQASVDRLQWLNLDEALDILSWQSATEKFPVLAESELATRITREILLILPETGQVVSGVQAIAQVLEQKRITRPIGKLIQLPLLLPLFECAYETVALNRRILTPPKQPVAQCSCEVPASPLVRVRFYASLLVVSILGLVLFSVSLAAIYEWRAASMITHLLIAMAGGWLFSYIGLGIFLRQRFMEYLQQSPVIMAIGGLWMLVSAALLWVMNATAMAPSALMLTSVLTLNLHTAIMLFSTIRRAKALRLPGMMPWLWLALYFGGYLFLIRRFF